MGWDYWAALRASVNAWKERGGFGVLSWGQQSAPRVLVPVSVEFEGADKEKE